MFIIAYDILRSPLFSSTLHLSGVIAHFLSEHYEILWPLPSPWPLIYWPKNWPAIY